MTEETIGGLVFKHIDAKLEDDIRELAKKVVEAYLREGAKGVRELIGKLMEEFGGSYGGDNGK